MITEIAFVGIPVTDMKRARSFYEGALGLKPSGPAHDMWMEYDIGPGTLALGCVGDSWRPSSSGTMAALEVNDLDAEVARLKAQGINFDAEKIESPVCHMAIVPDPDGNKVCLHMRKKS
jgi:predicted enzyme related to lactoylglutathione lyase